ncbi:MAG: hypothetical protein LBC82_09520 [Oscillospiraceae bacterium]|jgi:hypothetical protein|nr:hypothetical protein [Oscillospiraceae bacterium]
MKKYYLVLLIITAVLLASSCSPGMNPDDLDFDKSFSFTAELQYSGRGSVAQFMRTAPGEWNGTLVEPFALQGVEIAYSPLEMSVSYAGFAVNYGADSPPDINITAFVMIRVLESAFNSEDAGVTSGRDWIEITGIYDGDTYVLRLDKEGSPISLSVPNRQLKVVFSEVTTAQFNAAPPR